MSGALPEVKTRKKLIEVALPLEAINEASAREKAGTDEPVELSADEILDRILLPIVDEAFRARAAGVASTADIDVALRLGAAHPMGPFERATSSGGALAVATRLRELAADDPTLAPSEALLAEA